MTPQQATLMSIGSEMSNVLYNLGQHKRREITEREGELFYALAKKWDEARRAPAPIEPAIDRGLEAAAALVERKVTAYDAECGNTDPDTGTREYPGDGASWVMEMEELAEEIRALATPTSPAVPDAPKARQHAALQELVDIAQELDMGYGPPAVPAEVEPFKAMLIAMSGVQAVPAPARVAIIGQGNPEQFAAAMKKWILQDSPELRMFDLVCRLSSLKSRTPEAVNLLVEEAKRVMEQDGGAEGGA